MHSISYLLISSPKLLLHILLCPRSKGSERRTKQGLMTTSQEIMQKTTATANHTQATDVAQTTATTIASTTQVQQKETKDKIRGMGGMYVPEVLPESLYLIHC